MSGACEECGVGVPLAWAVGPLVMIRFDLVLPDLRGGGPKM